MSSFWTDTMKRKTCKERHHETTHACPSLLDLEIIMSRCNFLVMIGIIHPFLVHSRILIVHQRKRVSDCTTGLRETPSMILTLLRSGGRLGALRQ